MFFGVHLLTGAAIGAVVPDLPAATGLGLLSHYAIDHLPHWNYLPKHRSKWEDSWKMALEPLISIPVFLGLAWWAHWDAHILVPAFAAIIPDLLESAQYFCARGYSTGTRVGTTLVTGTPALKPAYLSCLACSYSSVGCCPGATASVWLG